MVSMDGQLLKETKQMTTVTSDDPSAPEERIYKEVSHFYQHINIGLFSSVVFLQSSSRKYLM
jgi:hypothetical protein